MDKDHESEQIMATRFVLGRVKNFNCFNCRCSKLKLFNKLASLLIGHQANMS